MRQNIIIAAICFLAISQINARIGLSVNDIHPIHLQDLSVSDKCGMNGYIYANRCYCLEGFNGQTCATKGFQGYENTPDKCDELTTRLDHLFNESPSFSKLDDNEFPRLSGDSIGKGEAAYGEKGNAWIQMHKLQSGEFSIFRNNQVHPSDVGQGSLGNCYLLAALASLANIRNGQPIIDTFETKTDNDEHVYVSRWLLDGKVRMVAVDDWVPANGNRPSFSKETNDGQFWSMIIEKQWAKIHGEFMITEGGWQTNVWKAMTAAPIGQQKHSSKTAEQLFDQVKTMLDNEWAIGAATVSNTKKDLVQGHAYSTLGAYTITSGGQTVKLVKAYNPWAKETYTTNAWAEGSAKWTDEVIRQIPGYKKANDGIFYLTHTEYHSQFGFTNWAEVSEGYTQRYKSIKLSSVGRSVSYDVKIQNTGNKPFYVSVETIDGRLIKGCSAPFSLRSLTVVTPSGKSIRAQQEGWETVKTAKIEGSNVESGTYTAKVSIQANVAFHKFFNVNTYAADGSISFDKRDDEHVETQTKRCPSDCSGNGICNTYNGVCKCDFLYSGSSCATKEQAKCPSDCNGNGKCSDDGSCQCKTGFTGKDCIACKDNKPQSSCNQWKGAGYCVSGHTYFGYMNQNCQKTCEIGTCGQGHDGEDEKKDDHKKDDNKDQQEKDQQEKEQKEREEKARQEREEKARQEREEKARQEKARQEQERKEQERKEQERKEQERKEQEKKDEDNKDEDNKDCQDQSSECSIFSEYGMCKETKLKSFMIKSCQKTCDFCGAVANECKPDQEKYVKNCTPWKNAGYCDKAHKYYKYLASYCPSTCEIDGCTPAN